MNFDDVNTTAVGRTLYSRRLFLQAVAAGVTVSALPAWLADAAAAASPLGPADGVLVLVTMAGGNDGLNTFIPTTNGTYHDRRPKLAIGADRAIRLTAQRGLHPRLRFLKSQWDQGNLAIVDGVGMTNPNLSHFDSMARVMTSSASPSALGTGWLGRYLDGLGANPFNGVSIGTTLPLLVNGRSRHAIALPLNRRNIFDTSDPASTYGRQYRALRAMGTTSTGLGPLADRLTRAGSRAVDLAGTVRPLVEEQNDGDKVATRFRLAARLINADLGIRVISIMFGDFDTHADQVAMHNDRMGELDAGLQAFQHTLADAFRTRTLVVGTSEFGRRVAGNGTGTDHGAANSLFALGHQVKGGLYGQMPSLTDLDDDNNLKTTVPFSQFYGNVLTRWLAADASEVLGHNGADLGFLNRPGVAVPGKKTPVVVSGPTRVSQRAQVARLYLACFGALPDEAGLAHWSELLISGARSLISISQALVDSPQFRQRHGSLSDRQFVELAYRQVLDRPADSSGLSHWLGVLGNGASRGSVMVSFSESGEFVEATAERVWRLELVGPIGRLYRAYFLRRPDDRGLTHWINSGLALPTVSDTFARSTEFLNRYGTLTNTEFVSLVYRNVLGRSAEPEGFRFWVAQADSGTARGDIMIGFSESPEFVRKVKALTP